MSDKKKIVVFLSGGGSNFKKIHKSILNEDIKGSIELLITNNSRSPAISYAQSYGLNTYICNRAQYNDYKSYSIHLLDVLDNANPDLILLAGYIKKLPKLVIARFNNKILNIHPSLLPKYGGKGFYGILVHKAVIDAKEKYSGATIHFVNENYDEGPIIYQKQIKVGRYDTPEVLATKVLKIEHHIFPLIVKYFCDDNIEWIDNKPIIKGAK